MNKVFCRLKKRGVRFYHKKIESFKEVSVSFFMFTIELFVLHVCLSLYIFSMSPLAF